MKQTSNDRYKCTFLFVEKLSSQRSRLAILQILSMVEPWTLILDDALANSFIAPATDDIKDDHQLICEFAFANLRRT